MIPPEPSKTGYHWVRRYRGGPAIPLWWNATWHENGGCGWGRWGQSDREHHWEYLGPCPSPDDVPPCMGVPSPTENTQAQSDG
jgi:hypothetical protein